jgi:hypothetical protein
VRRCRPSDVDETTSPRSILQTRFECRASHRHSPAAGPLSRAARILHIVRLGDSFPIRNCSPNPWGCPCTGRPSGTCRPFRSRRSSTRRAGRGRSARAAAAARRGGAPGSRRSQSTPSEGVKGRLRELRRIAPDCAELRQNCARLPLDLRRRRPQEGVVHQHGEQQLARLARHRLEPRDHVAGVEDVLADRQRVLDRVLHRERRVPPEELVDQHAERPPVRRERVAAAVGDLGGAVEGGEGRSEVSHGAVRVHVRRRVRDASHRAHMYSIVPQKVYVRWTTFLAKPKSMILT